MALLVAGVVHENMDGQPGRPFADLLEHGHYGLHGDVGGMVQGSPFVVSGVERDNDVGPEAPRCRIDDDTLKTPE